MDMYTRGIFEESCLGNEAYSPLSHGGHIVPGDQKALFYHAEPRSHNRGGEAKRGKTKLFWSPWTIWPPCDKGEYIYYKSSVFLIRNKTV